MKFHGCCSPRQAFPSFLFLSFSSLLDDDDYDDQKFEYLDRVYLLLQAYECSLLGAFPQIARPRPPISAMEWAVFTI